MATPSSNSGKLSIETLTETAVALIRSEGFEALSMRKLAQRCGVGAMTLYGYVRTKEELLTLIAEQFFTEVEAPDPALSWQEQLKEIIRATHRIFVRHPELAEISARQHFNATATFRGAELAFAAMEQAGLSPEDALSGFIALTAFTTGMAQRQASADASATPDARRLKKLRELPPDEFARVSKVALLLAGDVSDHHFEDGLDLLVRGIESRGRKKKK